MTGGRAVLLVAVAACHGRAASKEQPPAPAPRVVPEQPRQVVELLHAGGAKVAVSSVVANPELQPHDLVDGDLATAWNSRTGDLRGAWIAFRVPQAAHVARIRLTVGFTATGPEGDYFVLNHRVRAVRVVRLGGDGSAGTHVLDPEVRGLQDIAVDGPGGDVRIEVTEVVPGTRKDWRELTISELEVWGTPAPGDPVRRGMPEVAVGSLDAAPQPSTDVVADPLAAYPSIDAYCAEFLARPPSPGSGLCTATDDDCDPVSTASCGGPLRAPVIPVLPSGWTSATYFSSTPARRRRPRCNLAFTSGARVFVLEDLADAGCGVATKASGDDPTMSRYEIAMYGDLLALVLTTVEPFSVVPPNEVSHERLRLCGGAQPRCTPPITIGAILGTNQGGGTPGADGFYTEIERWSLDWKIEGTRLVLARHSGAPDDEARARLGRHRIKM